MSVKNENFHHDIILHSSKFQINPRSFPYTVISLEVEHKTEFHFWIGRHDVKLIY